MSDGTHRIVGAAPREAIETEASRTAFDRADRLIREFKGRREVSNEEAPFARRVVRHPEMDETPFDRIASLESALREVVEATESYFEAAHAEFNHHAELGDLQVPEVAVHLMRVGAALSKATALLEEK